MTPNTVLLVTTSYDFAADYVIRALHEKKTPFFRLDTDKFPSEFRATFSPSRGVSFTSQTEEIHSDHIKSVWYRRHVAPDLPAELDRGTRDFCQREARAFLGGVLATLTTSHWLSPPSALGIAEKKPYQLKVASDIGFLVPETMVTNDPNSVHALAENRQLVAKAVSSGYIPAEDGNRAIFTSPLKDADLVDLDGLSLAPVIFQELVEKTADIRVTIVGRNVFAAEILSQTRETSRIDWRATDDPNLNHQRHELPSQMAELCLELLAKLELPFGAIDLALRPDGEYVFFEINPNGEWAWIEDKLGFPISQSIAGWLDNEMA